MQRKRPFRPRRAVLVLALALSAWCLPAASAHAGIWTQIPSGTTSTITGVDYRSPSQFWLTTSSAVVHKTPSSLSTELTTTANFTDVAFNPSGTAGLAVGQLGQMWRFSGAGWQQVTNLTSYAYSFCTSTPQTPLFALTPLTADFTHVRWIDDQTVFAFTAGEQVQRSDDAGATWRELNRQADRTCHINASAVTDVFIAPSNPQFQVYLADGVVFLTTNGLAGTAARRGSGCGDRLTVDPANTQNMYVGGGGCSRFRFSEDGGISFTGPDVAGAGFSAAQFDFDAIGTTTLGAGDSGVILTSIDHRKGFNQPADGAALTNDWRSVDLASASSGAVGGIGGMLVVSDRLDTVPDVVAPTGSIAGVENATAGTPVALTASLADEAGGSGIDPGSLQWTLDDAPAGAGASITITPAAGFHTVKLGFADRAGNAATATKFLSIGSAPRDVTAPQGTIEGPDVAIAGQVTTYTARVSDAGAGIDPGSFAWDRGPLPVGTGATLQLKFPAMGDYALTASFRDFAGNRGTARRVIAVAPTPEDRKPPVPVPAPAPKLTVRNGRYSLSVKGGYRLPRGVTALRGCTGEVVFTAVRKPKRLLTARVGRLNRRCRYVKRITLAKGKVGGARSVRLTVRFQGNPWLAPVKRTYTMKVPR